MIHEYCEDKYVNYFTHKWLNPFCPFLVVMPMCERMELPIVFRNRILRAFTNSKAGLALPVTFLILLVSTLGIVAVTYYFSIERISLQSESLKVSTAKQNFLSLDNVILSTLWQPGSSGTFDLTDSGGLTNIQPTSNVLTIKVNDNSGFNETIFNASIGKITYELPYTRSSDVGLYLKGDSHTVINQSGSSMSQICIANGAEHTEIRLAYRPFVSYANGGLENGRAVTNIRIYILNLNSSDSIAMRGELHLKISCVDTQLKSATFDFPHQTESFEIASQLGSLNGRVSIPISNTLEGSVIYLETVISNVSIERSIL